MTTLQLALLAAAAASLLVLAWRRFRRVGDTILTALQARTQEEEDALLATTTRLEQLVYFHVMSAVVRLRDLGVPREVLARQEAEREERLQAQAAQRQLRAGLAEAVAARDGSGPEARTTRSGGVPDEP